MSGVKTLNFLGLEWHYAAYPAKIVGDHEVLVKFEQVRWVRRNSGLSRVPKAKRRLQRRFHGGSRSSRLGIAASSRQSDRTIPGIKVQTYFVD